MCIYSNIQIQYNINIYYIFQIEVQKRIVSQQKYFNKKQRFRNFIIGMFQQEFMFSIQFTYKIPQIFKIIKQNDQFTYIPILQKFEQQHCYNINNQNSTIQQNNFPSCKYSNSNYKIIQLIFQFSQNGKLSNMVNLVILFSDIVYFQKQYWNQILQYIIYSVQYIFILGNLVKYRYSILMFELQQQKFKFRFDQHNKKKQEKYTTHYFQFDQIGLTLSCFSGNYILQSNKYQIQMINNKLFLIQ
eukprot:TRINITY_DN5474_c0_g2_i12.p1 TRINITY_DN5474_c0_g2~~TRINITY_DN5474_c0_g2_i12.p1  ORF type:complete len:244 (+),score=-20.89 TRINITY_DN5474_c0_g2_i12:304-1035(+)